MSTNDRSRRLPPRWSRPNEVRKACLNRDGHSWEEAAAYEAMERRENELLDAMDGRRLTDDEALELQQIQYTLAEMDRAARARRNERPERVPACTDHGSSGGSPQPLQQRAVIANRHIPIRTGSIVPGQVCFIRPSQLFDGVHAFQMGDAVTVARAQVVPGGQLRLWWESPSRAVLLDRSDVEHLGAVLGCYGKHTDPIYRAYSN